MFVQKFVKLLFRHSEKKTCAYRWCHVWIHKAIKIKTICANYSTMGSEQWVVGNEQWTAILKSPITWANKSTSEQTNSFSILMDAFEDCLGSKLSLSHWIVVSFTKLFTEFSFTMVFFTELFTRWGFLKLFLEFWDILYFSHCGGALATRPSTLLLYIGFAMIA